jgi:hypothetical protein
MAHLSVKILELKDCSMQTRFDPSNFTLNIGYPLNIELG